MPIVAMTYEAGAQGKEVASHVAEKSGLDLACHRMFEQQVAERLHANRKRVHRFLQGKPGLLDRLITDQGAVAVYTAEQVYELASRGDVLICGWGATHLLRPVAHVLCVRICAPIDHRVAVLMEWLGIGEEEAYATIAESDAARAATMRDLAPDDGTAYDLVLDTARVPVAECVTEITRLLGEPVLQETAESRGKLNALRREAQVRAALRADAATAGVGSFVKVITDPYNGRIALEGAVQTYELKGNAERVVAALPWVSKVENHLHVVGPCRLE
ncbi:MAG TPA: cytidylate kinase family protein [Burkholderiales bacterium]|nr:cytidylate kinase family protein [Burkholderiales bacterium]